MAEAKILRPPFKWSDQKLGLLEDGQYKRWSVVQLRAMKNGTYDWKEHEEQRA